MTGDAPSKPSARGNTLHSSECNHNVIHPQYSDCIVPDVKFVKTTVVVCMWTHLLSSFGAPTVVFSIFALIFGADHHAQCQFEFHAYAKSCAGTLYKFQNCVASSLCFLLFTQGVLGCNIWSKNVKTDTSKTKKLSPHLRSLIYLV